MWATNAAGKCKRVLIRDVRCVPGWTDTLVSVDRLREDCHAEARFAGRNHITVSATGSSKRQRFKFDRDPDGLFIWRVSLDSSPPQPASAPAGKASVRRGAVALKMNGKVLPTFHQVSSRSHLDVLDAEALAIATIETIDVAIRPLNGSMNRLPFTVATKLPAAPP